MKTIFSKTLLIALALSLAACSSTPVRRSMKETWNDSLTASKIRYKMMRDSEVSKSHMHVEVYRGQVTLTGRSMTDAEKARAETLAKSVKRVTGVENYVHVVGGGDNMVAKVRAPDVPIVAVSPKAGVAPTPAIQEKTLVTEKIKVEVVEEDDVPAALTTIRESTGKPAVASRKAVESKAAKATGKNNKLAKGKSHKPEPKLATVRKAAAPVTTAKAVAPISAPAVTPVATQSTAPAAKVVGQSKTGLPWDGEVYEDDATRVSSPTTAARTPVPEVNSAPTTGGDLAVEAAQELEKLRQKK